MSTLYRDNQYEAVTDPRRPPRPLQVPPVVTDAGRQVYVRTHSFRHFGGQAEHNGCADRLLGELCITHVTLHQGRVEWFHCRRFCVSGYTASLLIGILFRLNRETDDPKPHVATVESYYSVATGAGGQSGLLTDLGGADGSAASATNNISDATGDDAAASAVGGESGGNGGTAANIDDAEVVEADEVAEAREILGECESSEQYKLQFIEGLGSRGPKVVAALVTLMGGKPAKKNDESNREKVKGWLEAPEGARQYHWMTVAQLTALFRARYKRNPPSNTPGNSKRQWLIDALASGWEDSREDLTFMDAVVRSGFLPSLKGTSAELCELGHKMEPIYGSNLLAMTKGGVTLSDGKKLEIVHLFRAGLLQSVGRPWQKASPDFLALARIDGEENIIVVEMKAR